jgi:hypothetical protein
MLSKAKFIELSAAVLRQFHFRETTVLRSAFDAKRLPSLWVAVALVLNIFPTRMGARCHGHHSHEANEIAHAKENLSKSLSN